MSLNDKILTLFEKYGSLSSERVKSLLKTEYKIEKTLRTIQRHIAELVKEEKLISNPSIRREQTYAVNRKNPSSISDFFLSKFWDELFKIRDELYAHKSEDTLADSWDSFYRLRSLVRMLPEDIKEEIKPRIESFGLITDEDKEKVAKSIGTLPILTVGGLPFGKEEWNRFEKGKSIIGWIRKKRIEDIIGEVATMLHEALEKERRES